LKHLKKITQELIEIIIKIADKEQILDDKQVKKLINKISKITPFKAKLIRLKNKVFNKMLDVIKLK